MRKVLGLVLLAACGDGGAAGDGGGGGGGADASTTAPDARPGSDGGGGPQVVGRCGDPAPAGAAMPPALPAYSGGSCPALVPGRNTIMTGGAARELVLVAPADLGADERPPVLFMWHHLGGDAQDIVERGQMQAAADELRLVAVIPEKKGDVTAPIVGTDFAWPYLTFVSGARVEEELRFFDDMLACVAEAYPIDESCISSGGVSAGALWTSLLLQRRGERLASAIVLSGGVGPALNVGGFTDVMPWEGAARAVPTLVLWGGPTDRCVVNFETASMNLETGLDDGGHFYVECVHNCGHAVPPVDPTNGMASLYRFALDHPYWVSPGASIYQTSGMPSTSPAWCKPGPGAVPREGMCTETTEDSGCPTI